jgi:uncharacterized membrane protein YedE/YeeE
MFGLASSSGMVNPAKVRISTSRKVGSFACAGDGGMIAVGLAAFALAGRRTSSALGLPMQLPGIRNVDARLIGGSVVFGIGWGLAGICPGPAIVALGAGYAKAAIFVAAMLLGMGAFEFIDRFTRPAPHLPDRETGRP